MIQDVGIGQIVRRTDIISLLGAPVICGNGLSMCHSWFRILSLVSEEKPFTSSEKDVISLVYS